MIYRILGNSGLKVSSLALGTMNFGKGTWGCDEKTSIDIINNYLDAGGNFIDTSNIYAEGLSEKIVGKAIKKRRQDVILSTKCGVPMPGSNINYRGSSRINIIASVDESLRRLDTDYIDLFYLHLWDPTVSILESLETLTNLVRSGKVRYIGASNYTGWQISETSALWKNNKTLEPLACMQSQYSLICREIEFEVIPACKYNNIGLVCWSPLGGGILADLYKRDGSGPSNERYVVGDQYYTKTKNLFLTKRNFDIVETVKEVAQKLNITPAVVSIAWCLSNLVVCSVNIGPRDINQLKENLKASSLIISDDLLKTLNEISKVEISYPYSNQDRYISSYLNFF